MPASASSAIGALPLGLAHGLKLARPIRAGQPLRHDDVVFDGDNPTLAFRREMEQVFGG